MVCEAAIFVAAVFEHEEQPRGWGSHPGRRSNIERLRKSRGDNLMEDYFVDPSVFPNDDFKQRYRMSHDVFTQIAADLYQYDLYWVQKLDAAKKVGFLLRQKMTTTLRMLAYGASLDQCAEYSWMAKSTSVDALQRFTRGNINLYSAEYDRAPNFADLRRLLAKADRRGFPGMIGSINCMHWQWKKCPTSWAEEYSGRKRVLTIILETVAPYDTWIWHALSGMLESCNDLNVLAQSPLFDELIGNRAPQIQFQANNNTYNLSYYLPDGIYTKWATFVKTIPRPTRPKEVEFFKAQEGYRKDVEQCFDILQSRFGIIRGATRGWDMEDIKYIMLCCIILHNIIVEDERHDDSDEDLQSDEEEENNLLPRRSKVWEGLVGEDFDLIGRDGYNVYGFMDRYASIRCQNNHSNLQADLIEHLWSYQGNMKI